MYFVMTNACATTNTCLLLQKFCHDKNFTCGSSRHPQFLGPPPVGDPARLRPPAAVHAPSNKGWGGSVCRASDRKGMSSADTDSTSWCGNFLSSFFLRVSFQCRLFNSVCAASVKNSRGLISVCVKIPNSGRHTVTWSQENTAHTGRNEYGAALEVAVNFLQGSNEA